MSKAKCAFAVIVLLFGSCVLPFSKDDIITLKVINKTAETVCISTGLSTIFSDGVRKIDAFKTETINVKKETAISAYGDTTGVNYGTRFYRQSGGEWIIT